MKTFILGFASLILAFVCACTSYLYIRHDLTIFLVIMTVTGFSASFCAGLVLEPMVRKKYLSLPTSIQ